MKEIFKELEERRVSVEKLDLDLKTKNLEELKSYWLHMTILSSAIVIGVLPLLVEPTPILSVKLAECGLGIIIFICVMSVIYVQSALLRTRSLLFEQAEFHKDTFSAQKEILKEAKEKGASDDDLRKLFEETKSTSFYAEQDIVAKHVLTRFYQIRHLINKYFPMFVPYGFAFGVVLIALSFTYSF